MAVDMFLLIDGIKGEAKDKTHKEEIDVLAWSWGMSQSGTFHVGGGGGSGKINMQDLSVTKWIDKSSADLMLACCNGDHIDSAVLVVRKAGEKPLEYFKITMGKLMVTAISTGGSGGEDRLTENITLNFARVKVEYQQQNDAGGPEGGIADASWDMEQNIKD